MKNQKKAGVILSYASQAVKILSSLLFTPIMLRLLGKSEYGLYQLVYSVVSYLSLLGLGFTVSYIRFYSRYKAKNNEREIAKLNAMFLSIFCVIALICVLCGILMVFNIDSIFSTGLTESEKAKARILMFLMVINMAITFPSSVFDCFTSAHEKFIFQKSINVAQNILNPFLCLPLLLMGYGSIAMVVVSLLLTIMKFIINIFYSLKILHIKFIFHNFDWNLMKEMSSFTFFIFLNQIIDQINWSVDKIILGRIIGTSAVAVYGLGSQINNMYVQFSTSISNVFVPSVNQIIASYDCDRKKRDELLTNTFIKVGRIQFIVLFSILIGFIFFGRQFMIFWGGKGYENSYYVALLLIGPVTVPLIQNIGIEIQRAENKHRVRSVVYLLIAIANIFISIPLAKKYAEIGAALGTAISLTAGNIIFMNYYYNKYIGLNIRKFWLEIISILPAYILPSIFGLLCEKFINISSILNLIIIIFIYCVITVLCLYKWGLNTDEKSMFRSILKKHH